MRVAIVRRSAGATGGGGLVAVGANAGARCGISMKGVDIVVGGSVGHMSAFMAQAGNLVVCGDAAADLGDFRRYGSARRLYNFTVAERRGQHEVHSALLHHERNRSGPHRS